MSVEMTDKWIAWTEADGRFGPCRELVVLIPRTGLTTEDWYFVASMSRAVPRSRVFDTPQEAALAAIKIHDETIRWAGVQRQQMQNWYDRLEAERKEKEENHEE